jgi:hypothetical protein
MPSIKRVLLAVYLVLAPLFLLAQAVLPLWILGYRLTMSIVTVPGSGGIRLGNVPPKRQLWLAWLICSLLAITEFLWLAPLAYLYYSTYFVARRFNARSAEEEEQRHIIDPASSERRECHVCGIFKADRTYHCKWLGRCLPLYDHYCAVWLGVIWGHNVKAYLNFIGMVFVHQLYCLIVSSWVLSDDDPYRHSNLPSSVVVAIGVFILMSANVNINFWYSLGICNSLSTEKARETRWFRLQDGFYEWNTQSDKSPFDLGIRRNLYFFMGPWWSWPLFWTFSPVKSASIEEVFEMTELSATRPFLSPSPIGLSSALEQGTLTVHRRLVTDSSLPATSSPWTTSRHIRPHTD